MRLDAMVGLAAAVIFASLACSGASSTSMDGSAVCTGPMSEVAQGCPATFATLDDAACRPYAMQSVIACGGLSVFVDSSGYGATLCAYDPSTHALVGAQIRTDVNSYCGGTSFTQSAGRIPGDCLMGAPTTAMRTCPPPGADGGADLADGGGVSE